MSKIGNLPVNIPEGVNVNITDSKVIISGPNGQLEFGFLPEIVVSVNGKTINVSRKSNNKFAKSLHGLTRSIIANMIKGVTEGHQKILELVGVGYRASQQQEDLVLNVGYSHPVVIRPLAGVKIEIKENKIFISGANKESVGEMAARIRRVRPPEPYKGKGIKYQDEVIRRKVGKAAKAIGGGP